MAWLLEEYNVRTKERNRVLFEAFEDACSHVQKVEKDIDTIANVYEINMNKASWKVKLDNIWEDVCVILVCSLTIVGIFSVLKFLLELLPSPM